MGFWNHLGKNVNRMEKNASDMKMLENDPEQFRADHGGHLGVQLVMLLVFALAAALCLQIFAKAVAISERNAHKERIFFF